MNHITKVYGPYRPKLRFSHNQVPYLVRRRVAGRCFRSERAILAELEIAYRSKVKRKRKVWRTRRMLLQVLFENGRTIELAYLDVGIKGYYVRYTKVKVLKWRDKKVGKRLPYSGPDKVPGINRP